MKIHIDKTTKDNMINEIKRFFENERDEPIGDLAAMMLFDFFAEKLGPHFYNQGVRDSYSYMSEKLEDLFEIEKK